MNYLRNYLDKVVYGNATQEQLSYLGDSRWNGFVRHVSKQPFPANSSLETESEIKELVKYQNLLKMQNNKVLEKYLSYDVSNPFILYKMLLKEREGKNFDEVIDQMTEELKKVVLLIKFHYQRPRPYQLAYYFKLPLNPYPSISALSPSYPSGHALQAYAMASYFSRLYPNSKKELYSIAEDISVSRMFLGLHYPSDTNFGKQVGELVVKSTLFNEIFYGVR